MKISHFKVEALSLYLIIIFIFIQDTHVTNLVPRAFPFLSLGRREKALAPGGHMTFNTQIILVPRAIFTRSLVEN
jgi:hypothetical protein